MNERRSPGRIRSKVAAMILAGFVVFAAAACTSTTSVPPDSGSGSTNAPMPTGKVGAADFDTGALTQGRGATVVDTYIDPMCPYCELFETANGPHLASLVSAGTITLRVHPMNFLDRSSQGTKYSTRASSALTCVAATAPDHTLDYLSALYKDQPKENSPGLTDKQLVTLADQVGATGLGDCIASGRYASWVDRSTQKALTGPIAGANITKITGTPTILVNGTSFTGDFTKADAVSAFIAKG